MSDFKLPPKKPVSPFAGWRGHHVGVRVKNLDEAKNWYVEKLDFRVVHEWPYADEQLAYIAPRTTMPSWSNCWVAAILYRLTPPGILTLAIVSAIPAITISVSTCRISRRPSPTLEPAVSRL